MLSCWSSIPENRPKFHDLEKIISELLGETKTDQYVDMNKPYLRANANRYKSDRPDYLALLASPNYVAMSVTANLAEPGETKKGTNDLHLNSDTLTLSQKDRKDSIALKTFKTNNLNEL